MHEMRKESDFLGDFLIPEAVWYGIHTARALENFYISGQCMSDQPFFVQAFAYIKMACARANQTCGVLDADRAQAISRACGRILAGDFPDQFCTDLIQGGAGTSVNMNVNEVIANIALVESGFRKGNYDELHPINHVNCSQSTNDTYPTAIALTLYKKTEVLLEVLEDLRAAFVHKASEFKGVLKWVGHNYRMPCPRLGDALNTLAFMQAEAPHVYCIIVCIFECIKQTIMSSMRLIPGLFFSFLIVSCQPSEKKIAAVENKDPQVFQLDKYKEGQVWSLSSKPANDSASLTILKVELSEKGDTILHVRLDRVLVYNPDLKVEDFRSVAHLPFSIQAIDSSVNELRRVQKDLPEYLSGYEKWKSAYDRDQGGYWKISVPHVVQQMNALIRKNKK